MFGRGSLLPNTRGNFIADVTTHPAFTFFLASLMCLVQYGGPRPAWRLSGSGCIIIKYKLLVHCQIKISVTSHYVLQSPHTHRAPFLAGIESCLRPFREITYIRTLESDSKVARRLDTYY